MRWLFTITIFLGLALLFLIEPMIAKMILPRFGGSPGVWNTSMLFFQAALLVGYGYAHLATKWLGPKIQAITHLVAMFLPLLILPFALPSGIQTGASNPAPYVLLILAISVGLPFFIVSSGAPLLQRWFATTGDPHARDPYFLYSASNVGSLLALLAYPLFIEPSLKLSQQARLWSYGYCFLIGMTAVCAVGLWLSHGKPQPVHEAPLEIPPTPDDAPEPPEPKSMVGQRARWVALAFCPSSLMLGITTYLTSNLAPVPLLWVIPLALYLVTFIVAFARKRAIPNSMLSRWLPLLIVPLAFTMILEASDPGVIVVLILLHLLVFFFAALLCHGEMADSRPKAERLTEFYFYVSLGGVLGGLFNSIIAPTLFNSYFEYPLVLAIACFFRPPLKGFKRDSLDLLFPVGLAVITIFTVLIAKHFMPDPTQARSAIMIGIPLVLVFLAADRPVRFAASLVIYFVAMSLLQVAVAGRIIDARRSFFGVHRVEEYWNQYGIYHGLLHGNTVHGKENFGSFAGFR